jgi:hypothetical protein
LDAEIAAGLNEWSAIKVECRKGCVTAFSNARSGEISLETHEPGFRKLPIVAELSTADDSVTALPGVCSEAGSEAWPAI